MVTFTVISNTSNQAIRGFTTFQFKKLDDLYCRSASKKILNYRTVECDFENGTASYTYYKVANETPFARFVIRRVGPNDMMYELYVESKGRVAKSGVFERTLEALRNEIEKI